jgi:hypothetical protein
VGFPRQPRKRAAIGGQPSGEFFLSGGRIVYVPMRSETRHLKLLPKAVAVNAQTFSVVNAADLVHTNGHLAVNNSSAVWKMDLKEGERFETSVLYHHFTRH